MIDKAGGVKTLEFNCRFGDPETQPIMCRLKGNFAKALLLALDGKLDKAELAWDSRIALGVVVAAKGYPDKPEKGALIESLPKNGFSCRNQTRLGRAHDGFRRSRPLCGRTRRYL